MIELLEILAEAEEDVNTGRVAPIKIIGLGYSGGRRCVSVN